MKLSASVISILLLTGLASTSIAAEHAVKASPDTSGPMTHEKFSRYVQTFNDGDLNFVQFYHPDIVFDKGSREGRLVGRQAIADWYRDAWSRVDEVISARIVVIDIDQNLMMVELRTQLDATTDGFRSSRGILKKGDRLISDGAIVYTLKDGLISSIRGVSKATYIIAATRNGSPRAVPDSAGGTP